MIFLKHFDTSKQTLTGAGKVYMARTAKVADLVPVINEKMRWTPGTPLKLYEEIKPGMIELMKPKFSFSQSEIQDGDVICFQVDIPDKEFVIIVVIHAHCLIWIIRAHDLESQGLHSTTSFKTVS
jgi:ubiquitin carboxyl-terminal hydrolase 7